MTLTDTLSKKCRLISFKLFYSLFTVKQQLMSSIMVGVASYFHHFTGVCLDASETFEGLKSKQLLKYICCAWKSGSIIVRI